MADAIRADRGEFLVDPTVGDKRLLHMQPVLILKTTVTTQLQMLAIVFVLQMVRL